MTATKRISYTNDDLLALADMRFERVDDGEEFDGVQLSNRLRKMGCYECPVLQIKNTKTGDAIKTGVSAFIRTA